MSAGQSPYDLLFVGDPAPWFRQRCVGREDAFSFDMAAGRFVALCFYGSARDTFAAGAIAMAEGHAKLFDGVRLSFFGVSTDPADALDVRLNPAGGLRHFADESGMVSRAFGVAPRSGSVGLSDLRRGWFVLDPRLRIIACFPLDDAGNHAAMRYLQGLPTPAHYCGDTPAPVSVIPYVFEPELCARLIDLHRASGGEDSAILTEGGAITDPGFKQRRDQRITGGPLLDQIRTRIFRRVTPEILHAFQFKASRMERVIVACYDAAEAGRFGAHRDNTIARSAHRRFAVSINLNDDFEGGGVTFPEYSARAFCPPKGGALVFSCSLMHAVLPMRRGRRYACLPFIYDDAAAELRRKTG